MPIYSSKLEIQRGEDLPNKKYYDPRKYLRLGQETFMIRLVQAFGDLNNINTLS